MTSLELLQYQINSVGEMIARSVNGLESASPDASVPNAFTLSGQLTHLAEAYQAVITGSEGGKHEWGTFSLKGATVKEMVAEMKSLREIAVSKVLVENEEANKMGADYIVGHDNYHLGQLVTLHLTIDPTWNSYEIYG